MRFNDYECFPLDLGTFFLDGGAMFGVVPKVMWEKKISADKKNRIPMKAGSLLIKGKKNTIFIDTGIGNKISEKFKTNYAIGSDALVIDKELSKYNLRVEDVTDVFITHLHFDHCGGSTSIKNGKVEPTFPNAIYYIQKDQWETALNPSKRDQGSFLTENFIPLEEKSVLRLLDGPEKLFEQIEVIVTHGHTKAQQHLLVKGSKHSIFFCADLIPTSAHLPVSWHMAYDNYPLVLLDEKEKILKRALDENWILFFQHDPEISMATIKSGNKEIEIDKVIHQWNSSER